MTFVLCIGEDGPRSGGCGGRGDRTTASFLETVCEGSSQCRRHKCRNFATGSVVEVGRRNGATSGRYGWRIVHIQVFAFVTAVGTTVRKRESRRGRRKGEWVIPIVTEVLRACEANLLEHEAS